MFRIVMAAVAAAFVVFAFAPAQAVPLTGTPEGNSFGWVPNSTNLLNYEQLTPGITAKKQAKNPPPYVLFDSNAVGQVTLDFYNGSVALEDFEIRIDGVETGLTPHPIVIGDTIKTDQVSLTKGTDLLGVVFFATQYVDVRLALGGEDHYDFDRTRFEVVAATTPLPAALPLFASGAGALGVLGWRRTRKTKAAA